jgi:hypothetical protein
MCALLIISAALLLIFVKYSINLIETLEAYIYKKAELITYFILKGLLVYTMDVTV